MLQILLGSLYVIHEAEEIHRGTPIAKVRHHLAGGNLQSRDQRLGGRKDR